MAFVGVLYGKRRKGKAQADLYQCTLPNSDSDDSALQEEDEDEDGNKCTGG